MQQSSTDSVLLSTDTNLFNKETTTMLKKFTVLSFVTVVLVAPAVAQQPAASNPVQYDQTTSLIRCFADCRLVPP